MQNKNTSSSTSKNSDGSKAVLDMNTLVKSMKNYVQHCIPNKVEHDELVSMARKVDETVKRLTNNQINSCLGLRECDDVNTADFKRAVFDENKLFGVMYPKTLCCMLAGEIDADGVAKMMGNIKGSKNTGENC